MWLIKREVGGETFYARRQGCIVKTEYAEVAASNFHC